MERLLIELSFGDGYTYGYEQLFPMVYESKEKAISDLETILIEYQEKSEVFKKESDARNTEIQQQHQKLRNMKEGPKHLEEQMKLMELIQENGSILKREKRSFDFGGQQFDYEDFRQICTDNEGSLIVPPIYTLDEYFAQVELPNSPKIKSYKQ